MNVLLINPPNLPFTDKSILIEPIDIIQIWSYIQSIWHSVDFLDMDVMTIGASDLDLRKYDNITIVIMVFDYHIPLHTHHTQEQIIKIWRLFSDAGKKVIVWWKMATYYPKNFLFDCSWVDVVIHFDMEEPLSKLLSCVSWTPHFLKDIKNISYLNEWIICWDIKKQSFDINLLPIAKRDFCDLDKYIDVRTILSSRWCPMRCEFCHVPWFRGKWQGRSPLLVVDEIQYLVENVWAKKILFLDDNAPFDQKRMRDICDEIIKRNIHVSLGCLSTIHNFNYTLMNHMYQAWFRWIHYWIETANELLSKSIKKNLSQAKIIVVIGQTRDIWLRVRTSWILDLPWTNESILDETCKLITSLSTEEIRLHFLAVRLWSSYYEKYWESVNKENFPIQYIHHWKSNYTFHAMSDTRFNMKVDYLLWQLQNMQYILVKDIHDNAIFDTTQYNGESIVSLCPLKYWIWW